MNRDVCWLYNHSDHVWLRATGKGIPPTRMGHATCFDPVRVCRTAFGSITCASTSHLIGHGSQETGLLYMLGGAKYTRFFRDMHVFDVANQTWSRLEVRLWIWLVLIGPRCEPQRSGSVGGWGGMSRSVLPLVHAA